MKPARRIIFMMMVAVGSVALGAEPLSAHAFLEKLCDDFGGRMTGSAANAGAMERLAEELGRAGVRAERMPFAMPGWERGEDRVDLVAPLGRRLRVAALGYTQAHDAFEAVVVSLRNGRPAEIEGKEMRGRVGVLESTTALQTSEIVALAVAHGLRAVLFINREGGGQLLARTGSFSGAPLPVPIYSIAQEEGLWLQRLLARDVPVSVRVATQSSCRVVETANLVVRVPGKERTRIIIGAHFDSWDLGQGAMDNGLGIAQLYALTLAWRGITPHHSLEFIWFNGEEQGLWGSRHAAAQLGDAPVVAMVNLDMIGLPIGVNALGDDSLVPVLSRWVEARGQEARLPKGVENINWVGSDHTPYQLAGVRTITFNSPIPRESVRYYHDFADTIDKVLPQLVDDSGKVIGELVAMLAGDASLGPWRRSPSETAQLYIRFGLEKRLRAMGLGADGP